VAPLVLLLAEFLFLSYNPLLPYNGPNLHLSTFQVTLENASRWIITRNNPAGQLTAFLVFDGWTNINDLLLAVATVACLLLWVPQDGRKYLDWSFLASTNIAGLVSPSMVYLFPLSDFGNWGMSAATFGALCFGATGSAVVLRYAFATFATREGNTQYRRPRNFLPLFFTLALFLVSLEYLQGMASADPVVQAVHLASAAVGGLVGLAVIAKIGWVERKRGGRLFAFPAY